MEKTINIDGKEVRLRATAAVPRLYRIKFGRDIMQDLSKLSDAYEKATTEQEQFEATDLGLFENPARLKAGCQRRIRAYETGTCACDSAI